METTNFAVLMLVLGIATLLGAGSMMWAYQGAGSIAVVFLEVMPVPEGLSDEVRSLFQSGVSEYCKGQYRRSANYFVQVLRLDPTIAAAHHNHALALANQREVTKATKAFLTAADLYTQAGDRLSAELVKQHLQALKRSVKPSHS
jgi:tetratricopeptide (TPR) repeat protein